MTYREAAEFEAEEHRKEREQGAYERVVESLVDDLMRGETIGRRYGFAIDLAYVILDTDVLDGVQIAKLISRPVAETWDILNDAQKRAKQYCEEFLTQTETGRAIVESCVEDEISEGRE